MTVVDQFLEGVVVLLPPEAGGRHSAIEPRAGSYRPFARSPMLGGLGRIRLIEGPPSLAPGEGALVVAEAEGDDLDEALFAGAELDLIETDGRVVGILSVLRLWRAVLAV